MSRLEEAVDEFMDAQEAMTNAIWAVADVYGLKNREVKGFTTMAVDMLVGARTD